MLETVIQATPPDAVLDLDVGGKVGHRVHRAAAVDHPRGSGDASP